MTSLTGCKFPAGSQFIPIRIVLTVSLLLLLLGGPFASSATADPGYFSRCTNQEFLAKKVAQASDGTWWKCDRSDIAEDKNGEYIRIYGWSKTKSPTASQPKLDTNARPMALCTTPGKTVKTANYGKLTCRFITNGKVKAFVWYRS